MRYSGSVVDLDSFAGDVRILNSMFFFNRIHYASCDVADKMYYMIKTNNENNHPEFGDRDSLLVKSVISIVNHDYTIVISQNLFGYSSGTKGIVYIDSNPRGSSTPVVISDNVFYNNFGYLDASSVFVRARDASTGDLSRGTCGGYHIKKNSY